MSEYSQSDLVVKPAWAVRSPEELADFYLDYDTDDGRSFAKSALLIRDAMTSVAEQIKARSAGESEIGHVKPLPVEGGGMGRKLYKNKMTQPQKDLLEAVYSMTNAEQKVSEVSDDNPTGRVWLSGRYSYDGIPYAMNFIETHGEDEDGSFMKWRLVTDVPEDLVAMTEAPGFERRWLTRDEIVTIGSQALGEIREIVGDKLVDEPPYEQAA